MLKTEVYTLEPEALSLMASCQTRISMTLKLVQGLPSMMKKKILLTSYSGSQRRRESLFGYHLGVKEDLAGI